MRKTQNTGENRREHMRVKTRLHFCVSIIEGVNEETGAHLYGDCFCTSTIDISLGGVCIPHSGILNVGYNVELTTPESMSLQKCLTCDNSYLYSNKLELTTIVGEVMWVSETNCGITFKNLSRRNENILSKFIWDEHLDEIRNSREKAVIHRKF